MEPHKGNSTGSYLPYSQLQLAGPLHASCNFEILLKISISNVFPNDFTCMKRFLARELMYNLFYSITAGVLQEFPVIVAIVGLRDAE